MTSSPSLLPASSTPLTATSRLAAMMILSPVPAQLVPHALPQDMLCHRLSMVLTTRIPPLTKTAGMAHRRMKTSTTCRRSAPMRDQAGRRRTRRLAVDSLASLPLSPTRLRAKTRLRGQRGGRRRTSRRASRPRRSSACPSFATNTDRNVTTLADDSSGVQLSGVANLRLGSLPRLCHLLTFLTLQLRRLLSHRTPSYFRPSRLSTTAQASVPSFTRRRSP